MKHAGKEIALEKEKKKNRRRLRGYWRIGPIVGGALEASSVNASSQADREAVEIANLTSRLLPVSMAEHNKRGAANNREFGTKRGWQ